MDNQQEMTLSQEVKETLLSRMLVEEDPKRTETMSLCIKALQEGDARMDDVTVKWNIACMENDREQRRLDLEERKLENDALKIETEAANERFKLAWDVTRTIGGAFLGISLLDRMLKTTVLIEKNGIIPSALFSKETTRILSSKAGEFIIKGLFRR